MSLANRVLTVVLVAQLLLFGLALAFRGGDGARTSERVLMFPGTKRSSVETVSITDDNGRSMKLARGPDGWTLPDHHDYPADAEKVDRVMGSLLGLESVYVVARGDTHHRDLEVADDGFRRKVTVTTGKGERTILVGGTGPSGYAHVRLEPSREVYAAEGITTWKLGTGVYDWAKLQYFAVEQDRVAGVEIRRGGEITRIERASLDAWRVDGEPAADKEKLDRVIEDIATIELSNIAGKAEDAEAIARLGDAPTVVTLSLAGEPLPMSKDSPTAVPPPGPIATDPDGEPAEPGASPGPTEQPAPQIAVRRVLRFAPVPDRQQSLLLLAEGASHIVEIDRWRVQPLLDFGKKQGGEGD
jgi:hypothetical protein